MITPGNTLKTLSAAKSVFANATVTEEFPSEFGIYDLNEFLGALSIYDDPEITFGDKYLTISQGGSFRFFSADPTVLTFPTKDIKMPKPFVEFDLSEKDLALIQKTAGIIGAADVVFRGDGETITVVVTDKKNATSNTFSKELGKTDKKFEAFMKQENMKFLVEDYTVSLSDKRIAQLVNPRVEYFVSLETDSVFG